MTRFKWFSQQFTIGLQYHNSGVIHSISSSDFIYILHANMFLRKPKTAVVDCHEAVTISSEHRIFSCITVVEHFDTLRIPILYKLMVSIKLKLISFVVVVTLIHCSGVVSIFSVLIPYALYKNTRWIFLV